ncbi:MAG: hypothetical protein ACTSW1_06660 [Candidatus Hodarchaeales archaeon]
MTLILTWLFPFGIVMGADSALTLRNPHTYEITGIETVQKIYHIPKINAGISCWGNGKVGEIPIETYLPAFIEERENEYSNIDEFATILKEDVSNYTPEITASVNSYEYRYGNRGFHLAGFVDYNGTQVPSFYHIHNGVSETYSNINPRILNANHDWPPNKVFKDFNDGIIPNIRNGDFLRYAQLFDSLWKTFQQLKVAGSPVNIPSINKFGDLLLAYSEFVRFWIRLTRDVYALSDLPEIIGGNISILSLKPNGGFSCDSKP